MIAGKIDIVNVVRVIVRDGQRTVGSDFVVGNQFAVVIYFDLLAGFVLVGIFRTAFKVGFGSDKHFSAEIESIVVGIVPKERDNFF